MLRASGKAVNNYWYSLFKSCGFSSTTHSLWQTQNSASCVNKQTYAHFSNKLSTLLSTYLNYNSNQLIHSFTHYTQPIITIFINLFNKKEDK